MEFAGFILAVVITLIVVVTFVSVALIRSRKRVWEQFARRHGLEYASGVADVQVHGTVHGRPFRLFTSHESSDSGPMGIQEVRMQLGILGSLPEQMRVSRVEGWVGAVDRMSEAQATPTGDEEFDRAVLVEARDPNEAKEYLTAYRRELIGKLMADAHADDAGIDGRDLFIQDREMLTDIERIEQRLAIMLSLAPAFDGANGGTPSTASA
jgi:hypothetical protein